MHSIWWLSSTLVIPLSSVMGTKWDDKLYRHHTRYPGALKEIVAKNETRYAYRSICSTFTIETIYLDLYNIIL